MLRLADSNTPVPFDLVDIDDRSDAELDALPFGVVALDDEGTILRYNLYESRLARLDRNQVLGRSFFREVAPCTRTEEFEGRFHAFTARAQAGDIERFNYLFDFKFGAQDVAIELLHAKGAARFYLLINRKTFAPPRADRSHPQQRGALQVELAPDEEHDGVLRDELERRFVDVPTPLFAALRAACDRLAPETWKLFASEWGVQWGRRTAVDLDVEVFEAHGRSLREIPMREVARIIATHFAERGFGSLAFDFALSGEGLLVVELTRSALAEAAPRSIARGAQPGPDLACHLVAGCLSGIVSTVAGRRLAAREVECVAGGAPRCSIVIVGHDRRVALDGALNAGTRGVEAARSALKAAPRGAESAK